MKNRESLKQEAYQKRKKIDLNFEKNRKSVEDHLQNINDETLLKRERARLRKIDQMENYERERQMKHKKQMEKIKRYNKLIEKHLRSKIHTMTDSPQPHLNSF